MQADNKEYYAFDDIQYIRQQLQKNTQLIDYHDFGAGPGGIPTTEVKRMRLSVLAEKSASNAAQGKALFRMVEYLKPNTILELGTSLGIGALYLCTPNKSVRYLGIEGNPQSAQIAQMHLDMLHCVQARVVTGEFSKSLPLALGAFTHIDLAYLDGDHREKPTIGYFESILPHMTERSVIVLDDIYWSPGMLRAFEQLKQHPRVHASLNMWDIGILFLDPSFQQKVHLSILPKSWKPWEKYLSE